MAEKQNTPEIRFEGFTDPWEQRKWSEYVSISTDMVDPRSGNYDNLPHVGPGNMESFTGRLYDNVNTVKDDALISGKFHFDPGDIIYGKINPQLGKYTYAQFEGLASADAYVLNGKNGLTQEFLFGILQTKAFFDYSVSVSMRSGMPKINRDELNAFEFLAPNESEQRAIGDILLKLDDLITLHQRKCQYRGLYGYLSWEQRKLGNCGTTYGGLTGKTKEDFGHGNARFIPYTNVFDNPLTDTKRLGAVEIDSSQNQVAYGDAFFTVSSETPDEVGMSSVWLSDQEDVYLNSFCFGYRQDSTFDPHYLAYMLRSRSVRSNLTLLAQGISRFNISKNKVMELSVPVPSAVEQEQLGQYFTKLDSLITLHQ